MGRPGKYPEEFKREVVELYRSSDRPRCEVARSLGISDGSLAASVKQAREAEEWIVFVLALLDMHLRLREMGDLSFTLLALSLTMWRRRDSTPDQEAAS